MTDSEESDLDEVDQLASENEYEVESILSHRKRGSMTEYLVKWKDYDDDASTWEPADNLGDAQAILDKYLESIKGSKSTKKRGRKTKREHSDESEVKNEPNDSPSTIKRIKIIVPTNTVSPVSKKAKLVAMDDDVDEEFVDAISTGFGSDDDLDTSKAALKQTTLKELLKKKTVTDGLERIEYQLESEDGENEKISVIVDSKYPAADVDWEAKVDRILVVIGNNKTKKSDLYGILKWVDGKYSLHSVADIRKSCPQHLIDYYTPYVLF